MLDTRESPATPPLDVVIRRATPEDAAGIARVNLDTWRVAYRDLLPRAYLDKMSLEKGEAAQREHLALDDQARFVAVSPQRILGYCAVGKNRVPVDGYASELYGLYVHPAFQKMGLGNRLFDAGLEWLRSQRYGNMIVWVLKDNPARSFYEKRGGRDLHTTRMRVFSGTRLVEISYGWESI